jgi:Fe-S-cluster containining protein
LESSNRAEYDCIACGRCCYYNKPDYALLYPEDIVAFGPAGLAKHTTKSTLSGKSLRPGEDGSEIYMRMENGHCCALEVTPDVSYTCSIYEGSPLLCRMFEPGSADCLEARARPTQEMPPNTCGARSTPE